MTERETKDLMDDLARRLLEDALQEGTPIETRMDIFKLMTPYVIGAKKADLLSDSAPAGGNLNAMKAAVKDLE